MNLITAVDKHFGIGLNNSLPWKNSQELKLFKSKTMGKAIVVGRNTYEHLPKLPGRKVYCLTRNIYYKVRKGDFLLNNIEDILSLEEPNNIYICGGAKVYSYALKNLNLDVSKIHISIMKDTFECDTYFDKSLLDNFVISSSLDYEDFTHYVLEKTEHGESQYLNCLKKILYHGVEKKGRNGITKSLFTNNFSFDLTNGFPLITTKRMFLRGVIEEFLFFMLGQTNTKILEDKGVNIWKGNTERSFLDKIGKTDRKEGMMGPMYGYQFRHFGAEYSEDDGKPFSSSPGIDQLKNVVNLILTDPNSRRILMTSYNPAQAEDGCLYPCHSLILQFYVEDDFIDMYAYSRSADMFLGIPFNIAYYSLVLMLISKLTHKTPRFVNFTTGDTHIYEEHYEAVKRQIDRIPYKFPTLHINKHFEYVDSPKILENIDDFLENLSFGDFVLTNYQHHKGIRAKMVA